MNEVTLGDFALEPLPEGWKPVGVIALIKCLDEDSKATWAFRTSEKLTDEETYGALLIRAELSKLWMVDAYTSGEE